MKVYYIGAYDGCYYIRCLLPLVANGWYGQRTSLRGEKENWQRMLQGAMASDVIVFQRPMQEQMVEAAKLLKLKGKKIVLDNDDTYIKDSGVPTQMLEIDNGKIDERIERINTIIYDFAKVADLITTTTEFLKEEYSKMNDNIKVLPNMVDPLDWPKPKRSRSKKVRVGLMGSVLSNLDYQPIKGVLQELSDREDVELVIFGLPPKTKEYKQIRKVYKPELEYWNSLNIEWHPFVPVYEYMDKMNELKMDILLIPRYDNYFNRCKSNVKFLEASMLEIPVIAQGFEDGNSPYQKDKNIRIATTEDEWRKHINELIENKELRRKQGKEARKYVLEKYNIYDNAHLWEDCYNKLLK